MREIERSSRRTCGATCATTQPVSAPSFSRRTRSSRRRRRTATASSVIARASFRTRRPTSSFASASSRSRATKVIVPGSVPLDPRRLRPGCGASSSWGKRRARRRIFARGLAPATSGRLDILLRCLRASLLVSHGLREDTIIYLVLMGGPQAHAYCASKGARRASFVPTSGAWYASCARRWRTTRGTGRGALS